ncbi:HAT family dimerization domain containing protein, partial [Trifolium pratense]
TDSFDAAAILRQVLNKSSNSEQDSSTGTMGIKCAREMVSISMLDGFGYDTRIEHEIMEILHDVKIIGRSRKFGSKFATYALETKTPTQWWESYGGKHPELQWFYLRVFSLTCSSKGCGQNWSAFERKRNRLKQITKNKVVFVMVNSKLGKKNKRKSVIYEVEEIYFEDEGEEWIENVEDDQDEGDGISLVL